MRGSAAALRELRTDGAAGRERSGMTRTGRGAWQGGGGAATRHELRSLARTVARRFRAPVLQASMLKMERLGMRGPAGLRGCGRRLTCDVRVNANKQYGHSQRDSCHEFHLLLGGLGLPVKVSWCCGFIFMFEPRNDRKDQSAETHMQ